jgi:PAS domain S-box-containing protein
MRLLIADDDRSARAMLRGYARAWGHEVIECTNGVEALEQLERPDAPTLAILDWMMPGLDGPEVCRRVRARNSQLYVILLTSRTSSADVVRGLAAGADDHLSKLAPVEELRSRLQAAIRIAALQEQVAQQVQEQRVLFRRNPCPMWVADGETGEMLDVNDAACALYGYTPEAFLRLREADLARDGDTRPVPAAAADPEALDARAPVTVPHRRADGGAIEVQRAAHPIAFQGRAARLVVAQDVTRRQLVERLTRLQHAVTRTLAEAATQADAMPVLLRLFGDSLGFDLAELWQIDVATNRLTAIDRWKSPGAAGEAGRPVDLDDRVAGGDRVDPRDPVDRGSDLAWLTRDVLAERTRADARVLWTPDVPHLLGRAAAGFTAALGIPIIVGPTILAIVQLTGRAVPAPDPECLDLLAMLGSQIGQFVIRKQSESQLQQAHEMLHALVAGSPLAIVAYDRHGLVQMWNRAAVQMFGWSEAEALGRDTPVVPPEAQHESARFRASVLRGDQITGVEVRRQTKEGQLLAISLSTAPVRDAGGAVIGMMAIYQDVTGYRLLQAQLAQAQKLESIGQLAAGVAHEINTPMQYVGDNVDFLRTHWPALRTVLAQASSVEAARTDRAGLEPWAATLAATIAGADLPYLLAEIPVAIAQTLEGVERVSGIVQAMKEFSHPGVSRRVAVDINRAIATTINIARHEWKYVCDIATDFAATLPPVSCMPGELTQVILNLLVNAAQAIAEAMAARPDPQAARGLITIRTRHTADAVEISITDTGTGIPEAIRTRIFDPFFTTKDVGRGTGQGLAIAHNVVVQKHHGRIWFETEPGTGTTFHVQLPLHETGAPHADIPSPLVRR